MGFVLCFAGEKENDAHSDLCEQQRAQQGLKFATYCPLGLCGNFQIPHFLKCASTEYINNGESKWDKYNWREMLAFPLFHHLHFSSICHTNS